MMTDVRRSQQSRNARRAFYRGTIAGALSIGQEQEKVRRMSLSTLYGSGMLMTAEKLRCSSKREKKVTTQLRSDELFFFHKCSRGRSIFVILFLYSRFSFSPVLPLALPLTWLAERLKLRMDEIHRLSHKWRLCGRPM